MEISLRTKKIIKREGGGLELVKFYHDVLVHGSKQNIKYNIGRKYTWERMNKDIDNYVDQCEICKKRKTTKEI